MRSKNHATTFGKVIDQYLKSQSFLALAPRTQVGYAHYLQLAKSAVGRWPTHGDDAVRPAIMQAFLDGMAHIPAAQQAARRALSSMGSWAIVRDLLPRDIMKGTVAPGNSKGGHVPWTEDQIALAVQNTSPELGRAILLAANTGQRSSDTVKMRWSDVEEHGGRLGINLVTQKVGLNLWVPFADEAVIKSWERRPGFIILSTLGVQWTPNGLSSAWVKERLRREALAPMCDPPMHLHGLRGYYVLRLRRLGYQDHEIASIVGMSVAMVARYCRKASQIESATRAMDRVEGQVDRSFAERLRERNGK